VGRSNAAALVPDDNEDDDDDDDGYASDVSLVSIGSDGGDVYPNHLFLGAHGAKVYAVRAAGRWVVSGSRDSTFRIWRLPDLPLNGSLLEYMPQEVYAQVAHEGSVLAVAVEDQGETGTIVTGGADACVKVWEVQWGTGDDAHWTGTECRHVATVQHGASVSGVALTREYLVSCSHDGDVRSKSASYYKISR
jgi:WD40 repeat protein